MTVQKLVVAILVAIIFGLIAEYFLRQSGIANLGGTIGGLTGIIVALILNRKKSNSK